MFEHIVKQHIWNSPPLREWSAKQNQERVNIPHFGSNVIFPHELRLSPFDACVYRIMNIAYQHCGVKPTIKKWSFFVGSSVHNTLDISQYGWQSEVQVNGKFTFGNDDVLILGDCDWWRPPMDNLPAFVLELKYASFKKTSPYKPDLYQVNTYRLLLNQMHNYTHVPVLCYIGAWGIYATDDVYISDDTMLSYIASWWKQFKNIDLRLAVSKAKTWIMQDKLEGFPEDTAKYDVAVQFLHNAETDLSLLEDISKQLREEKDE